MSWAKFIRSTLSLAVAATTFGCAKSSDDSTETGPAILEYDRSPNTTVVYFDIVGCFTPDVPRMRIFGDGRVIVHRSSVAEFEMYLSDEELQDLLLFLYNQGVLTFDISEARRNIGEAVIQRQKAGREMGRKPSTSQRIFAGGQSSIIRVWLDRFRPAGEGIEYLDYYHHAAWSDLWYYGYRSDFPEIPEIANFADASTALFELTKDPKLRRIPE